MLVGKLEARTEDVSWHAPNTITGAVLSHRCFLGTRGQDTLFGSRVEVYRCDLHILGIRVIRVYGS